MPEKFNQYYLTETLSKKYSHVTYLASPRDEPEHQLVLTVFSSFLFHFPYERESFLQKAHCVKQLQHEHVFSIHEMEIEEEQPFVVREYLPDGSLRRWLKQLSPDRLPLRDALSILLQVGEALVYAHQQNIVHGAIKPENIFLDGNGQVLVTDFNLVSRKDACIRDQASEEYAFCYLAPEQFAGLTDARSDQYALGCLAYELITGRVPFAAQSLVSMMGQARNDQPASLSESVAALPATLDAAVLKTLAKDPTERFFDFSLFLEVIQSVLSPPPNFPLAHAISSRKNKIISHSVRSTKVRDITFPLSKRTASPNPASEPPEQPSITSHDEYEKEVSVNASSISQLDMDKKREVHPLSKLLASSDQSDQIPFPFPGEAHLLADRENEKEAISQITNKSFIREDSALKTISIRKGNISKKSSIMPAIDDKISDYDYSKYIDDESSAHEYHQSAETECPIYESHEYAVSEKKLPLKMRSNNIDDLQVKSNKRRKRRIMLLVSGVMALTVYIFWSAISATHDTGLHTADKTQGAIPRITSVSVEQVPLQVTNIPTVQPSVTQTPTVQPSVTQTPTVQPSVTQTPTVQPVVPVPVTTRAPVGHPTPTPMPKSTPTPTPMPKSTPTPTPTDASVTYEAESPQNTLTDGARIISCSSCSGGYRVGYLGIGSGGQGGTLQFNNVNKADAGTYTLTLYYSNGSNSDADEYISVNGGSPMIFTGSPTGGFDKFATVGIAVALHGGKNTIEFYNPKGPAPDIDKIII